MPDYSVVIPAWNESAWIASTLDTVNYAMQQQQFRGEVIVVDNNSTDDTAAIARHCGAKVVFEPVNQIARARNAGARESGAHWLIFLDADTKLNQTVVAKSLQSLASGNVIGGGSIVALDREVTGIPRLTLIFWNWWSKRTNTAAGCYIYCTKAAFDTIGGFDEKHFAAEELHFSKKMRKLAKANRQRFEIQTVAPVISSARKLDWYSPKQFVWQVLLLLIPGSTSSRSKMPLWYNRKNIRKR